MKNVFLFVSLIILFLFASTCEDDDMVSPPVITTDTTTVLPSPDCPIHDTLVAPATIKSTVYSDLNTFAPDMTLNKFKMVTESVGYIVGSFYKDHQIETPVFKTLDGGFSWSLVQTVPKRFPIAMHFANEDVGFIRFSFEDSIVRTTNGGLDWETIGSKELKALVYTDENICYSIIKSDEFAGSYLLQSTDLGNSWDTLIYSTYLNQGGFIRQDGILIIDDIIYATGSEGRILKISPEGLLLEILRTGQSRIKSLFITDDNTFFIEGSDGLLRSVDEGQNWELLYDERTQIFDFFSSTEGIIYKNNSTCTYAHDEDIFAYTNDNGYTWIESNATMTNLVNQTIPKSKIGERKYLLLFYNKLYLLEVD